MKSLTQAVTEGFTIVEAAKANARFLALPIYDKDDSDVEMSESELQHHLSDLIKKFKDFTIKNIRIELSERRNDIAVWFNMMHKDSEVIIFSCTFSSSLRMHDDVVYIDWQVNAYEYEANNMHLYYADKTAPSFNGRSKVKSTEVKDADYITVDKKGHIKSYLGLAINAFDKKMLTTANDYIKKQK